MFISENSLYFNLIFHVIFFAFFLIHYIIFFRKVLKNAPSQYDDFQYYSMYYLAVKIYYNFIKSTRIRKRIYNKLASCLPPSAEFREALLSGKLTKIFPAVPSHDVNIIKFILKADYPAHKNTKVFLI